MSATQPTFLTVIGKLLSLQKYSGVDSALQKQKLVYIEQIHNWGEILKCISDIVFFLAEHDPFFSRLQQQN